MSAANAGDRMANAAAYGNNEGTTLLWVTIGDAAHSEIGWSVAVARADVGARSHAATEHESKTATSTTLEPRLAAAAQHSALPRAFAVGVHGVGLY